MIWRNILGTWLIGVGTVMIPEFAINSSIPILSIITPLTIGFILALWETQQKINQNKPYEIKIQIIYKKISKLDTRKAYKGICMYDLNNLVASTTDEIIRRNKLNRIDISGDIGNPRIRKNWLKQIEHDAKFYKIDLK